VSPFEAQVLEQLRRQTALLERLVEARAPARDADADELARLLPAIRAQFGDSVWAVADLVVAGLIPERDGRRIGRLLMRNAGRVVEDLVLHPVGSDRAGRLWVLRLLDR
jgi:hypothetical protein